MSKLIKLHPKSVPEDLVEKGYYFLSEKDNQNHYFIQFEVVDNGVNVSAKIYSLDTPQIELKSGDYISVLLGINLVVALNLWSKYYFPEFCKYTGGSYFQWYYDIKQMRGLTDTIDYAVEKGLEIGEIETY